MENYCIPVIPFHKEILVRGEGSYVFDEEGKKYLDLNSGQFCTVLGHSNSEVVKMISDTAQTLVHTSSAMLSRKSLEAAAELHRISGDMKARSILLSTGAEAVEFAIRYAKHLTGKSGMMCFEKGYHGLTLGTQSVTFAGRYAVPQVEKVRAIEIPDTFVTEEELNQKLSVLEEQLKLYGKETAAVLVEPIVSVGGMIFPGKRYFKEVEALCRKYEVLVIFDESQTGFGRTGEWFCYQQFDVVPDMVVCAKGIGLGYPVSAVLMKEELLDEKMTMTHYSSHQNDPFSSSIVCFGIKYMEENGLLGKVKEKGSYFLHKLQELCQENDMYQKPRGMGLMMGVDLQLPGIRDYRPVYSWLSQECARKGVLIQGTDGGRVLRFLPDYILEKEDIDFCIEVLKSVHYE